MMEKYRAYREGVELWAAARSDEAAAVIVVTLIDRGYEVEEAPDLPDPVWPEDRSEDWLITPPGWDLSHLDFLYS